jgi:Flp pilus assembly protein TadD
MRYAGTLRFRFAGILLCAVANLNAQKGGAAGTATSGSTSTTTGRTPGISNPQATQPQTSTAPPQTPIPVFLYGRVMMDDGTPPPSSTAIKKTCSGAPRTVGFTSSSGQFSLSLGGGIQGSAFDVFDGGHEALDNVSGAGGQNASQTRGTAASLAGCELSADLAGFRSDRVNLSMRSSYDTPDLGVIVLHRIAGVQGTSVSATALNAPKDARKAWEKGARLLHLTENAGADDPVAKDSAAKKDARLAAAEKEFQAAVALYPKYANAWSDLGRVRMLRNDASGAQAAYLKAIDADGKLVQPHIGLGEQSLRDQDWVAAARHLGRALELDPVSYPGLWFPDAVANYNVHNYDRAERGVREALKLPVGKRDPHANELLGLILFDKRDYAGAKEAITAYLNLEPAAKETPRIKDTLDRIERAMAERER